MQISWCEVEEEEVEEEGCRLYRGRKGGSF